MKGGKTNAIRILESQNIRHRQIEYDTSDEQIDAVSVAGKIQADPFSVFKTLVAKGETTGVVVFCIPGDAELHMKNAAKASGNKKIEMLPLKELLPVTGYIRGGCSPIGMKKQYPTFIDKAAQLFESIYVSAGVLGMQIYLSPNDLLALTEGQYAALI